MSKLSIIKEMMTYLRVGKKWWLLPILVVLVLLGAILVFAESSALAPLIYSLF